MATRGDLMWKGLQEKKRAYEFYRAVIDLGLAKRDPTLWGTMWFQGAKNSLEELREDRWIRDSILDDNYDRLLLSSLVVVESGGYVAKRGIVANKSCCKCNSSRCSS